MVKIFDAPGPVKSVVTRIHVDVSNGHAGVGFRKRVTRSRSPLALIEEMRSKRFGLPHFVRTAGGDGGRIRRPVNGYGHLLNMLKNRVTTATHTATTATAFTTASSAGSLGSSEVGTSTPFSPAQCSPAR